MRLIAKPVSNTHTMFMIALVFISLLIAMGIALATHEVYGCNVCHSKNPKMVKMHEELGFKDCFTCHGPGMAKTPESQKAQMIGDERCIPCHNK